MEKPDNVIPFPGTETPTNGGGNASAAPVAVAPIDETPVMAPATREATIAHLQAVEARLTEYLYSVRVTIALLATP